MRRDSTLQSILRARAGRLFCGALLLVTTPSVMKRCGCDKEDAIVGLGGPFAVSGMVFDFESQAPVPGVGITFDGPESDFSAVTDATGHFAFTGVPMGTYDVHVEKSGFDERKKSVLIDMNTTSFNIPIAMIHMTPLMIRDTFVRLATPASNFETEDYLLIGATQPPGDLYRTFLQIGSSNIPADAEVTQATMTAYFYDRDLDVDAHQFLFNLTTPWDPATVNWATQPQIGTLSLGHVTHLDQQGPPFRIEWDITDVVTTYRSPTPPEPVFGVEWAWDKIFLAEVGSTECAGPSCGGALTGKAWWYREAPDFP